MANLKAIALGLGLLSAAPAFGADNFYGQYGLEAYRLGRYELAENFLTAAIEQEYHQNRLFLGAKGAEPDDNMEAWQRSEPYRTTLAQVFWETEQDFKLLDYSEAYLGAEDAQRWWCRVLERRGHPAKAERCWGEMGEQEEGKRALRTRLLLETFAPGATFGHRPPPPVD